MDIRVYNANQIGGCFTVITTDKAIIMIDYGLSLPGALKEQESFDWNSNKVDAVFFTHYHGDHVGRILEIPVDIPIYMGSTARKIMLNIHSSLAKVSEMREEQTQLVELLKDDNRIIEIKENAPIREIPGMVVTPYSVDHSAYDAYMYLIESENKVILHTGDFRGHGYRDSAMLNVIKYYIHKNGRKVDYLITEGTMMGIRQNEEEKTEYTLKKEAEELFKEHKYIFLVISSTNLDSLSSFYQAARVNGMRTYCYNYYLYKQLKTFQNTAGARALRYRFDDIHTVNLDGVLEHHSWKNSKTQEELMREHGFLCIIKPSKEHAKWIERFQDKNPFVIYSMWDGYIDRKKGKAAYNEEWASFFKPFQQKNQFMSLHTSGHATAKMITDVIKAVDPQEAIIPMHTENAEGFKELEIEEKYKRMIRIANEEKNSDE